jgi:hypothetical protein
MRAPVALFEAAAMPANLVLGALQHVWRSLEPFKPMVLMGGLAPGVCQHFRATRDIELRA